MGVLLHEVVLGAPDVVIAEAVGQLGLLERVGEDPVLAVLVPRPGDLQFEEDAEFHVVPPSAILSLYRLTTIANPHRLPECPAPTCFGRRRTC